MTTRHVPPDTTTAHRALQRQLRLRLRELAVDAGLGREAAALGFALRSLWQEVLRQLPSRRRDADELVFEFVAGCCSLARWLDPARSAGPVAPFAMVMPRHATVASSSAGANGVVVFVMPADSRRAAAEAWVTDVRQLLAAASVDVRAVALQAGDATSSRAEVALSTIDRVWGCRSLFHRVASRPAGDAVVAAARALRRRTLEDVVRAQARAWRARLEAWSRDLWRGPEPLLDESWLAGAVNLHDLELRLRTLDRRRAG